MVLLFKNDKIRADNGTVYIMEEDALMDSSKNSMFIMNTVRRVMDETDGKIYFMKYTEVQEGNYYIINLKREQRFHFCYPYIEHTYETFEAETLQPDRKKIFCVLLEYIDGENLRQYCEKQIYNEDFLWTDDKAQQLVFCQIMQFLKGMRYYLNAAEKDPYLHCDLKPENIMITKEGKAVLVDFDYSHTSGSTKTRRRAEGYGQGYSWGYSEWWYCNRMGREAECRDMQADIFSAGLVIFYWLNRKDYYLYWESNADHRSGCTMDTGYFHTELRQKKYQKLRAVMNKMCADRSVRYKNADQVIADMEVFLMEYCSNSMEQYAKLMQPVSRQLLDRNLFRNQEHGLNVICKVSPFGDKTGGNPLFNYAARDISVNKKVVMTIYNLDSVLYYIAYDQELRHSRENDFTIHNEDKFTAKNYEIQFWVN